MKDFVADTGRGPDITFSRYQFIFHMEPEASLPDWMGSMWRGALGHALKRTACVTRQTSCEGCLLRSECAYSYLFDTAPPPTSHKMRRYNRIPTPYLISDYKPGPGGRYQLTLTLIDKANRYLPYLIHALGRAGREGLGKQRIVMELDEVRQEWPGAGGEWKKIHTADGGLTPLPGASPTAPDLKDDLHISLETPLRVKRNGRLVAAERFRFSDLYCTLLRRLSMLSYFHGGTPYEPDFVQLTRMAREVEIFDAKLEWREQIRYSSRQRTRMNVGGLLGGFRVRRSDAAPFWPDLWIGQWLHVGKFCTMGLGRYRL